jgi:hypothetical protein
VEHYPPERIAFHMRTPIWCRHAEEIGPACSAVIAALLEVNALFRLRAAQGVLGLRAKHAPARLEAACAKAIEVGDPSYARHQGHPGRRNRNHHGAQRVRRLLRGRTRVPARAQPAETGTGPSDEAAQA